MSKNKSKLTGTITFGLSFLDILSCGLGAATLLLLIVKHGPTTDPVEVLDFLSPRIDEVQANLESLETTRDEREVELAVSKEEIQRQIRALSASSQLEADRITAMAQLMDQLGDARSELASSQARLQDAEEQQSLASSRQDEEKTGDKGSLIGLEVEKDRVLILLDSSASMLASTLVEIIRLRVSNDSFKRGASKWVTAREAAEWAYLKIDDGGSFQILTYSNSVRDLSGNVYTPKSAIRWRTKNKATDSGTLLANLRQSVPNGPTDLKTAFEVASNLTPTPNQIFLITDGYPSLPGTTSLRRMRDCPRVTPGRTPFLSPACRLSIFLDAANIAERKFKNTRIDTVLLPLEGDVSSIHGYWMLSSITRGRLLTPAPGWPYL